MMNKFQKKAFECEIIGEVYETLENRCHCYMKWDEETLSYIEYDANDSNWAWENDRLAVIREVMKKVEKML